MFGLFENYDEERATDDLPLFEAAKFLDVVRWAQRRLGPELRKKSPWKLEEPYTYNCSDSLTIVEKFVCPYAEDIDGETEPTCYCGRLQYDTCASDI